MKRLIAFDLDGTLAKSKQPLDKEMARLLGDLSRVADICVISGGDWPQFRKQLVRRLPRDADLGRFFIMPTTGAKLYRHVEKEWRQIYAEDFSEAERGRILAALDKAIVKAKLTDEKIWGDRIEDRGSQITFSGLGQKAPLDAKEGWDPDRRKRKALQKVAQKALPDLSVNIGGSTSIDITRKGVDKAYGIARLVKESGIARTGMIFLGDAVYPGGNDYPVPNKAKVDTIAVSSIDETKRAVQAIILCLRG